MNIIINQGNRYLVYTQRPHCNLSYCVGMECYTIWLSCNLIGFTRLESGHKSRLEVDQTLSRFKEGVASLDYAEAWAKQTLRE